MKETTNLVTGKNEGFAESIRQFEHKILLDFCTRMLSVESSLYEPQRLALLIGYAILSQLVVNGFFMRHPEALEPVIKSILLHLRTVMEQERNLGIVFKSGKRAIGFDFKFSCEQVYFYSIQDRFRDTPTWLLLSQLAKGLLAHEHFTANVQQMFWEAIQDRAHPEFADAVLQVLGAALFYVADDEESKY